MRKKNPTHVPTEKTRAEVFALSSYGVPISEIALFLGIKPTTVRNHYREELDLAHVKRNAKVGEFLFQNATGATLENGASYSDCIRAAMFWAKTRMGWRETSNLDHRSGDGSMSPRPLADFYGEVIDTKGDGDKK